MEVVFLYGFSKLKYGQISKAKIYACVARCTQPCNESIQIQGLICKFSNSLAQIQIKISLET